MEEENEIIHEANESQIRNVNEFKIEDYIKSAFKIYRKYFLQFPNLNKLQQQKYPDMYEY